mmetsp:Transcript_409/g.896  ORF Transcript_409/g.896 Transcript_409/m.896 type:complete len:86 (-) Transcript_409:542-799(-)
MTKKTKMMITEYRKKKKCFRAACWGSTRFRTLRRRVFWVGCSVTPTKRFSWNRLIILCLTAATKETKPPPKKEAEVQAEKEENEG